MFAGNNCIDALIFPKAGRGLIDRLIAGDYRRTELITLTLDRNMGTFPQVCRL